MRSRRVRFKVGRRRIVPQPGVQTVVAPGTRHLFRNIGPDEARIRAHVRPALEIEAFLRDAAELARAGYYGRHRLITGPPSARPMA